jgi:hypothetical protein
MMSSNSEIWAFTLFSTTYCREDAELVGRSF